MDSVQKKWETGDGAAVGPFGGVGNVESGLGGSHVEVVGLNSEVVAKSSNGARFFDVVDVDLVAVDLRSSQQNFFHEKRANIFSNNPIRGLVGGVGVVDQISAHNVVGSNSFVNQSANEIVLLGERSISSVLDLRGNPSVSNSSTFEVNLRINSSQVFVDDLVGDSRDVVSGVGFTSDEEVVLAVLRISSQETLDVLVDVGGDDFFVAFNIRADWRITSTERLVNVKDTGVVVPAVWVWFQSVIVVDGERSVFKDNSEFTRASRSTCHPQNDWIRRSVVS